MTIRFEHYSPGRCSAIVQYGKRKKTHQCKLIGREVRWARKESKTKIRRIFCTKHDPIRVLESLRYRQKKYWYEWMKACEMRKNYFTKNKDLPCRLRDLLNACKAQHDAIDILFALLIEKDPTFFPSKSGKPWQALLQGNEAIKLAEEK